jgi:hypothetical protein
LSDPLDLLDPAGLLDPLDPIGPPGSSEPSERLEA